MISVGNTFGVTKAGVLYATGANISGTLTAGSGSTIGPWNITANSIYKGTSESFYTSGVMYFGDSGLSLGNTFKVTNAGKLTATDATIGPWNVTSTSIYKGTSESFYTSGVMYFGNSGLSLSNTFKVTSSGELTATIGTIGQISMSGSYGLYTNSKTSATSTNTGFLISKSGAIYLGAYNSNTQACPF